MRLRTTTLALSLALGIAGSAGAADRLAPQQVDKTQISVSGISSGAFMANQLHVAHSAKLVGAGIVAGGLHGCAVLNADDNGVQAMAAIATGACMTAPDMLQPAATYAERIKRFAAQGWIDPVENLANSKLYAFTGKADSVVNPATVERAVQVYGLLGLTTASFSDKAIDAGHSWVTQAYGVPCSANETPYITKCGYDQSKLVLQTIYGPLKDAATTLSGRFVTFDQTEFVAAGKMPTSGIWDTGVMYVPAACEAQGANCRLHVALHGCLQSAQALDDRFWRNIGMNEWADTNRTIVLYPQARTVNAADFNPPGFNDLMNINPQGCWNWWGYAYDKRYLFKDGVQISAIWKMVQRVSGVAD